MSNRDTQKAKARKATEHLHEAEISLNRAAREMADLGLKLEAQELIALASLVAQRRRNSTELENKL